MKRELLELEKEHKGEQAEEEMSERFLIAVEKNCILGVQRKLERKNLCFLDFQRKVPSFFITLQFTCPRDCSRFRSCSRQKSQTTGEKG